MQNIEIKARVDDLDRARRLALELGARPQAVLHDTDTYFRVPHGRLKLRVTQGSPGGTLIAYRRPDRAISRISDYRLVAIADADEIRRALGETLGVLVEVRKTREVLIYGATRIHLDDVQGLGSFVELETVLTDQSPEDASREHQRVWRSLQLSDETVVPVSYSDLLMGQNG